MATDFIKIQDNQDCKVDVLVIKKLAEISKDIININITKANTLEECTQMFYNIMRKHQIKKYTKTDNGYIGDNYEWSICRVLFQDTVKGKMWTEFILDEVPKDLMY